MRTVFCLLVGLFCTVANGQPSEANNGFADGQKSEVAREVQNGFG